MWLDAKTNQPLKSVTKWVCADTGKLMEMHCPWCGGLYSGGLLLTGTLLMDSQIKYSYPFGGAKVIFDKEEALQLRSFDKKSLRLIGFKPRSVVKAHLNLAHSSFIYPDEQVCC